MDITLTYKDDAEKAEVLAAFKAVFRLEKDEEVEAKAKELALKSLKNSFFRGQLHGRHEGLRGRQGNLAKVEGAKEGEAKEVDRKALREERIKSIRERVRPNDLRKRSSEIFGGA